MKLTKIKQKLLDEAYHTVIQVCLFDKPLEEMAPLLAEDVMNFGAGKKELTRTKAAFLKQIKNQKELASGLKMDFQFTPILRKVINGGNCAIYTDDIVNTVWVNNVKSELKFRLSFIFEYDDGHWLLIHSHTSTPDSQRIDDEIWPVEELKKRTAFLEKSLEEKVAELHDKNRELEIEAALERVRSKTMAMHNSADVGDTVVTLFDEVLKLGLDKSIRCGIGILEGNEQMETWSASYSPRGKFELRMGQLNMTIHPMLVGLKEAWKKNKKGYAYEFIGKDVTRYYRALNNEPEYPFNADLKTLPEKEFHNSFFFSSGILFAFTENPISEAAAGVLQRFTNVFGQTYRRYLDLQKAEAQAREGQIEAALERVRASSMAMHKSEQLPETSQVLFEQFALLGNIPDRISIGIFKEEENIIELWATDQIGSQLDHRYSGPLNEATTISKTYKAWKEGKDSIVVDLSGQKLKDWVHYIKKEMKLPINVSHIKGRRVQQAAFFSKGILLCTTNKPVADEVMHLLIRFAKVFDQTYTRFLDLQKAEANALDAIRRSSVDRVRAEIASMRTKADLDRITPLIWNELTTLGVPFVRCGVFIFDEKEEQIHTFLSKPDGKAIAAFHLPYDSSPFVGAIENWRSKKIQIIHWENEEFSDLADTLVKKGQITSRQKYLGTVPKGGLYLHYVPFLQGILYVGNTRELTRDNLQLVQSVADAFSTAYARYEDFNKLELAKKQVEQTLTDLKQTQEQLVQSEKMASLGELTAGIAHEIQNPLNFVNNFSEVSSELIDEMNEELDNGDFEEAKALAADIKQNLEKINHHGKRADGIVKGMLQHSRTSSGQKEATDINVLADEYLRLAYHGLRAKDKTFNATMNSEFDENIGKIKVVPQDIGRVILNLITNAFYVVKEKSAFINLSSEALAKLETSEDKYEPTVSVSTKKTGNQVLISVKDNGNGIPKKVLEKIFQPFFTTKPTGQGTGLGLSLSYDIVHAHGGELKVNTKEGEGSEFTIILPVNHQP
jgi:signal transduction histidine kinase